MKTFKLVSLHVLDGSQVLDVVLKDGLIINKEDDRNKWLLEAYTDQTYMHFFKEAYVNQNNVVVQVVISKKENDPATFDTKVCNVKIMQDTMSILFDGSLKRSKNNYAELLLDHLIHKGLSGNALMVEFKENMKTKPRLEERGQKETI